MPRIYLLALFVIMPNLAQAQDLLLRSDLWSSPRNGETVINYPGLQQLLHAFEKRQEAILVINYPSGDEGILWAEELRAWLVALGVPSKRLELQRDSAIQDIVRLKLIKNRE